MQKDVRWEHSVRLALAAAVLCAALIVVSPASGWSPQQVGDSQQAYSQFDPYQLNIVQRGRDFLRYDRKGKLHGVALSELVHAYADLYVATRKLNRATIKLVGDIFDPVSAYPLCTGVRVTKWLKRLIDAYSNAETTLDAFQLVALDQRIKQDLRYIDYLHHWIDRYNLRTGRFTNRQNPNNRTRSAVHSYFGQLRRDVKAAAQNAVTACRPVSVSLSLFSRGPGRAAVRGTVTATGAGLSVSTASAQPIELSLPIGATVTITAIPAAGTIFAGWHAARCGWPYENTEVPGVHMRRPTSWTCTITAASPPVPGQGHGQFVIVADAFFCDPANTPPGLCDSLPREALPALPR